MKKYCWGIVAVLAFIFLCFIIVPYGTEAKEGYRIIDNHRGFQVEVPEMCPDFLSWRPTMLGQHRYENGNAAAMIESRNEEETVFVTAIWASIENKPYCLALIVSYFPPKFDQKIKVENQIKVEYFVDSSFMQGGKASNKLIRAKDVDIKRIDLLLGSTAI